MSRLFTRNTLFVLLSAVIYALGVMYTQFYLAWIALVPFFMVLQHQRPRKAIGAGIIFGLAFCAIILYWMISLVGDFAGKGIYGLVFYGIALLLSAVYFGSLSAVMAWLAAGKKSVWAKALITASAWTLGEWMYSALLPGMPWFGLFRVSNMVLGNLYAIQWSAWGGAFLIGFCVVLVNALLAHYMSCRQWKMLWVPVVAIGIYMLAGYGMYRSFRSNEDTVGQNISVDVLCDNTPPDVKWNENNGPALVKKLLELHQAALLTRPDIELWSESVVPWTYRADDDFIKEVLKMTGRDSVTHIMGMTTDYAVTEVYNSAYAILPGGQVSGRYDKRYPVSLAEKPFVFLSLPFSGKSDRPFEKEGDGAVLLFTPKGKAGVLICNDGTVPGATVEAAKDGAVYLVSLSNDAWFSHVSFLVDQHFYNTRLRAVEVRKDLVINCNMGFSGLVSASGDLDVAGPDDNGMIRNAVVKPNKLLTGYASFSLLFIYVNGLFMLIFIMVTIIDHLKPNKQ